MDEPSRRPPALKTLARALTAEAVDALAGIMRSGASEHARIAAATAILDRAHAQRLAAVEHRTREVDTNAAALAVLTSTVSGIDRRLQEVADDVKIMMLGSGRSQLRRDSAG
jgi:hypothetical protein